MKIKRLVSAFLSVVMAGTIAVGLTGCDKGSSSDTLVWYMVGDAPEDQDAVMAKANEIIESKIGMKLEMKYIDSSSYQEKMKLKMASGESYDLAFTGYCNNYQDAVAMGGLYDITELIDEVGMNEAIPEFFIDAARVDGKVYGIPNVQVVSNPVCLVVEKALIEEQNIDINKLQNTITNAKNMDDLKAYAAMLDDMFAKVKAARPDKYTFNPMYNLFTMSMYEEIIGGIVIRKDGSSTKLEKQVDTEAFKFSKEKLYEWYSKGYIRSDIASQGNTLSNDEEYRKVGVTTATWKPGQDAEAKKRYGYDVENIFIHEPYVARTSALATMIGVGANSKHPKEAVEFIKLINTDKELYNIICWGIEGTHYTKNEEGKVKEIEESGYNKVGPSAWKYGNQFNSFLTEDQEDGVWEETEKMNNEALVSPLLGFVPNTESIATELANINSVGAEYKAKISYGTEDPAVWYEDYKKALEVAGIDKVLAELQKQYDDFLASKK